MKSLVLRPTIIAILMNILTGTVSADCITDRIGDCVKTRKGEIFCSTEQEGYASKERYGTPRCQGQCELASFDYGEAKPAGR